MRTSSLIFPFGSPSCASSDVRVWSMETTSAALSDLRVDEAVELRSAAGDDVDDVGMPGVEREPARAEEAEAAPPVEVVHGVDHVVAAPASGALRCRAGSSPRGRASRGSPRSWWPRLDVLGDRRRRREVGHLNEVFRLEVDDSLRVSAPSSFIFRSRAAVSIVMLTRIPPRLRPCRLRRPRLAAVAIEAAKTIVPVLHRGNPCASGASAGSAIV